jgi:hypothetical protein
MNEDKDAFAGADGAADSRDAALGAWVRSFNGFFPAIDADRVVWHAHLPGRSLMADSQTPETARREVEALIAAAVAVRDARPARQAHQRVYVALSWPDWLSHSEFGVFLDPAYGLGFESRQGAGQIWTPLDPVQRSLSRELGFRVPLGFIERGFHERMEEEDGDAPGGVRVFEGEVWMIREAFPT